MKDFENYPVPSPSELDDNYQGIRGFAQSHFNEETSLAETPGDDSPVSNGKTKPGKEKKLPRQTGGSRRSLAGDNKVAVNERFFRQLRLYFTDDEYSCLKFVANLSHKSIGTFIRDCVLTELKSKKVKDGARVFFDVNF